jgi:hypothetical protein
VSKATVTELMAEEVSVTQPVSGSTQLQAVAACTIQPNQSGELGGQAASH